jgi:transposase
MRNSGFIHAPQETKATLQTDTLEAVADRGYFSGEEILACDQAGITVTLPKPMTSGAKSEGRFGKQDFVYLPEEDVYRCPAGERLKYYFTNVENGLTLRCYRTNACRTCALKSRCTPPRAAASHRWSANRQRATSYKQGSSRTPSPRRAVRPATA